MRLKTLALTNFRLFHDFRLDTSSAFTFITGHNGCGKTSLLEAIYYLMSGRSFRKAHRKELVRKGEELFFLEGELEEGAVDYGVKSSYRAQPEENRISLGGMRLKSYRELIELFPVIPFLPEDHRILSESPVLRRNFFDRLMAYSDIRYYDLLLQYQEVLKNRNGLLKSKSQVNLEFWDEKLSLLSEKIIQERHAYVREFNSMLEGKAILPQGITAFKVSYRNEMTRESMLKKLQEQRGREMMLGFTLFGPHRDDFDFRYALGAVKRYASAGQLKTLAFFLKMLQASFMAGKRRSKPILLMDDIFAELDPLNRKNVLTALRQTGFQTIFTAVDMGDLLPFFEDLPHEIISLGQG